MIFAHIFHINIQTVRLTLKHFSFVILHTIGEINNQGHINSLTIGLQATLSDTRELLFPLPSVQARKSNLD